MNGEHHGDEQHDGSPSMSAPTGGSATPSATAGPAEGKESPPWVMAEPKEAAPGDEQSNPLGLLVLAGLFALLWFGAGPRYFLVVIGLMIMILLHELGHFMTARWTGMKATQFFLFMGPRLWSFRRGETEYGIRLLPLGAFVRIVGMNNLDPCDPEDEPRAYKNKSYPQRMLVITAGSMMHFIQALVLFITLASVIGIPDANQWSIRQVSTPVAGEAPPPAVTAGLQAGETIAAVDGISTENFRDLQEYVGARPGESVDLEVMAADGTVRTVSTQLSERVNTEGEVVGFLGVAPEYERTRRSPLVGIETFGTAMWTSIEVIPRFLSPATLLNLVGLVGEGSASVDINSDEAANRPISMVGAVRLAGDPGFDWVVPLTMLAYINIFVGVFNLVPLLPLDGGHAAIATYERIRSRPGRRYQMDVARLLPITYAVVFFIGFLMLTTVWLDIVRPIG